MGVGSWVFGLEFRAFGAAWAVELSGRKPYSLNPKPETRLNPKSLNPKLLNPKLSQLAKRQKGLSAGVLSLWRPHFRGLGMRVLEFWSLGFMVWGLEFGGLGLGLRLWGLRVRTYSSQRRVWLGF